MPTPKTDTPQADQQDISGTIAKALQAILAGYTPGEQPQIAEDGSLVVKGRGTAGTAADDPLAALLTPQLTPGQRLSSTIDLLSLLQRASEAQAAAQSTPATPSIASLLPSLVSPGQVYNPGFEPGGLADVLSNLISGGRGSTIQDSSRMVNRIPVADLMGSPGAKVAPAPLDVGAAKGLVDSLLATPSGTGASTTGSGGLDLSGLSRLLGQSAGGINEANPHGTMIHVGEGKKAPSDEYVYLPPGSKAVVAPRKRGEPVSMQNAMVSVARTAMKKKGKMETAAGGGTYGDFNGLQAAGGDWAGLLQLLISGYRAADQNQSILAFSNQLGLTNPAAYGQTDPNVIRGLLGQGTPTLAARQLQATIANQQLQAQLDREQLAAQMGLNSQQLGLKSQELNQNAMMNQQDLALKRELGEGQLALGNRQADLQARQMLSDRSTRQLAVNHPLASLTPAI